MFSVSNGELEKVKKKNQLVILALNRCDRVKRNELRNKSMKIIQSKKSKKKIKNK